MSKEIYADHAATTAVRDEVLQAMIPYFKENYGNPSSVYKIARMAKKALDLARTQVARAIGAAENEIFFTSGGTESDNWAIRGLAEARKNKGKHLITSVIEHPGSLHVFQKLEKDGFEVTYLPVYENGIIKIDDLSAAIRDDTILISIMFANNEIGTIQPISEIGAIARAKGIVFHTDAVQAVGHIPVDVKAMNIDLLSLSGHKIYGPKGTAALYVRKGVAVKQFMYGGAQEYNKRAGTENVPGIVGLGKAMELAVAELEEEASRLTSLRDRLIDGILGSIDYCWLNGDRYSRLPGNANIGFQFIEGESILLLLDSKGIYASSGSACTSGSLDPSHVLLALGLPHEKAHGSLRLTLGRENTVKDVDYIIEVLPQIVKKLRDMSPLYVAGNHD